MKAGSRRRWQRGKIPKEDRDVGTEEASLQSKKTGHALSPLGAEHPIQSAPRQQHTAAHSSTQQHPVRTKTAPNQHPASTQPAWVGWGGVG